MKTAIVIGSGLAGLTAAYRLQQQGWRVTVLEKSDHFGGRVVSVEQNGYLIDVFASAFSETYVEYIQLLHDIGLAGQLVDSTNIYGVVRNSKVHYVNGQRPLSSFVGTKLMSWPEKLRFVAGALKLRKYLYGASIADAGPGVAHDHLTISDVIHQCFGKNYEDSVIDPMMRLVTFGDFRATSAVELITGLVSASGKYVSITGGIAALPRALASHVEVLLSTPAVGVAKRDDRVEVRYRAPSGIEDTITADACVIACPFQQALALDPPLAGEAPLLTRQTAFAPSVVVHLGYAAPTRERPVVVVLPKADFPYNAAIFVDHTKAPDRAPRGHSLFTLYYAPEAMPIVGGWPEERLVEHGRSVVERFFPELSNQLDMSYVRPAPYTCHLAPPGYFKAVAEYLGNHAADDPVQLAGDYLSLPSQESAVAWGNRAAQRILAGT